MKPRHTTSRSTRASWLKSEGGHRYRIALLAGMFIIAAATVPVGHTNSIVIGNSNAEDVKLESFPLPDEE